MTKNEISCVIYVDHNQLCKAEKNSGVVLCLYKVEINALITVVNRVSKSHVYRYIWVGVYINVVYKCLSGTCCLVVHYLTVVGEGGVGGCRPHCVMSRRVYIHSFPVSGRRQLVLGVWKKLGILYQRACNGSIYHYTLISITKHVLKQ